MEQKDEVVFCTSIRDISSLVFENPYFFNPRREVLNEQLAQVVEGLEFAGLAIKEVERKSIVMGVLKNGRKL